MVMRKIISTSQEWLENVLEADEYSFPIYLFEKLEGSGSTEYYNFNFSQQHLHGRLTKYHDQGKNNIAVICNFDKGILVGTAFQYDKHGNKLRETKFNKKGEIISDNLFGNVFGIF